MVVGSESVRYRTPCNVTDDDFLSVKNSLFALCSCSFQTGLSDSDSVWLKSINFYHFKLGSYPMDCWILDCYLADCFT